MLAEGVVDRRMKKPQRRKNDGVLVHELVLSPCDRHRGDDRLFPADVNFQNLSVTTGVGVVKKLTIPREVIHVFG